MLTSNLANKAAEVVRFGSRRWEVLHANHGWIRSSASTARRVIMATTGCDAYEAQIIKRQLRTLGQSEPPDLAAQVENQCS